MKTAKLGELVKITIGRTPSRGNEVFWDKTKNTSNIWLSIADLLNTDGKVVSDSKEYIANEAAETFAIVPEGTLLVSFKLTLGRLAYAGRDLRTNEAIAALHNDQAEVTNDYLYYYLSRFNWNDYAKADQKVKGLTLNKAKLAEIKVIYPESLEEQQRIVTRLDAAFDKIDRSIMLTERNLMHAKSLYISERKRTIKELSGNESKFINQIGKNLDSMRIPITKSERKPGEYPYYGASGVVDHVDSYIFDQEALLISEDGANLLTRSTPIAFIASGKYWVNNHAHIYEFQDKATLKYVEFYFENLDLKPYITGAAQPKLSQGNLNKIPIFIPSIKVQEEVVDIITKAKEKADQLADLYREKLAHLNSLKQSLLTQAFSQDKVK